MGDDLDHLIVHSMACTLEEDDGCAMGYGSLRFGSLHEVIKIVHEGCFKQGNGCLKQGKKMHKVCLERGKRCLDNALNEASNNKKQLMCLDRCSFEHPDARPKVNFSFHACLLGKCWAFGLRLFYLFSGFIRSLIYIRIHCREVNTLRENRVRES